MKTFRLFGFIMMLVMGLTFSSCSEDDENEPEPTTTTQNGGDNNGENGSSVSTSSIIGSWYRIEGSGYGYFAEAWAFDEYGDYAYSYAKANGEYNDHAGTFSVSGNTLTINMTYSTTGTVSGTKKLSISMTDNNTLIIDGNTFTREEQEY